MAKVASFYRLADVHGHWRVHQPKISSNVICSIFGDKYNFVNASPFFHDEKTPERRTSSLRSCRPPRQELKIEQSR